MTPVVLLFRHTSHQRQNSGDNTFRKTEHKTSWAKEQFKLILINKQLKTTKKLGKRMKKKDKESGKKWVEKKLKIESPNYQISFNIWYGNCFMTVI